MASFTVLAIIASVFVQTYGFRIKPRLDGRIVGGEDANIEDFPYQVSLQYANQHFCGASIIGNNVVLTAAHCTDAYSKNLKVRTGSSFTDNGGELVNVIEVNQHPNYDALTVNNDVSVLKLAQSLPATSHIKVQPEGQAVPVGALAVVSGWGVLYEEGESPEQLQKVELAHLDHDDCRKAYGGGITNRMTCYATLGKDSCQGDSGGPLVYENHQVGIVSWGYGCANPQFPGVYTDVANKQINKYIEKHSQ